MHNVSVDDDMECEQKSYGELEAMVNCPCIEHLLQLTFGKHIQSFPASAVCIAQHTLSVCWA